MIEKIFLKNIYPYSKEGITIETNHKVNFFFGNNGTGKSTITKLIRNSLLSGDKKDNRFVDCSIDGLNTDTEAVYIYDEVYKKNNFMDIDKQNGIFSLNEKNKIIDEEIKQLNIRLTGEKDKLRKIEERAKKVEQNLSHQNKVLYDICFEYRRSFDACSKLKLQYGSAKKKFFEHLLNTESTRSLSYKNLIEKYEQLYETDTVLVNIDLSSEWRDLKVLENKLQVLLNKVIIGGADIDISQLIQKLHNSSWVSKGIQYLEESDECCPFCQQKIVNYEDFKNKLNLFFDESYTNNLKKIRDFGNEYYTIINRLLELLTKIPSHLLYSEVNSLRETIIKRKDTNLSTIRDKLEMPNGRFIFKSLDDSDKVVQALQEAIENHNKISSTIESEKKILIGQIFNYITNLSKSSIEKYRKLEDYKYRFNFYSEQNRLKTQECISVINNRIRELSLKTVNTSNAVDHINKMLKYTGFNNFSIVEVQNPNSKIPQYKIQRNEGDSNMVYRSLSEGEKTFISFLYFYHTCIGQDTSDAGKQKIIVIDDPISSLDSKSLFYVASIIENMLEWKGKTPKTLRKEFKEERFLQFIILTHNLYFFKEITLDKRPSNKDNHFHYLYKNQECTDYQHSAQNTIFNDYKQMWESLKTLKQKGLTDKDMNIHIANTMRRIIDSYMDFIGCKEGNVTWNALKNLENNSPLYLAIHAFISMINDGSHQASPYDEVYYENLIMLEPSVLFDAFESLFNDLNPVHYEAMMCDR